MSAALAAARWRRLVAVAATISVFGAVAWSAGLVWFIAETGRAAAPPPVADGIVALTGGADRVATALRLLALQRGGKLLISGVGPSAGLSDLARAAAIDPAALGQRVTLGRAAMSTRGNAAETAAWATENNIRSLIVVTAGYHMPRAMTELARAMPGIALYPAPVSPPAMRVAPDRATLRLLAAEYTKFLASALGLDQFFPDRATSGLHA